MFDVLVQRENELRKRKTGYLEEHNGRLMEKEQSQGDTRSWHGFHSSNGRTPIGCHTSHSSDHRIDRQLEAVKRRSSMQCNEMKWKELRRTSTAREREGLPSSLLAQRSTLSQSLNTSIGWVQWHPTSLLSRCEVDTRRCVSIAQEFIDTPALAHRVYVDQYLFFHVSLCSPWTETWRWWWWWSMH